MATKELLLLMLVISLCGLYVRANDVEIGKSSDFTFNFYKKIFNKNENMVMCPMAIRYLLGLIYQSATSETENELRNVLNFDTKANTLRAHTTILPNYNIDEQLLFINKLYMKSTERIEPSFNRVMRAYHSESQIIAFRRGEEIDINNWISDNTHGKIESIISNTDLEGKLILTLNCVYFHALWRNEFDEDNMELVSFTTNNGKKDLNMMTDNVHKYNYTHMNHLKSSILEIPYKDNGFNFWIILPDENSNIEEVHEKLSKENIFNINRDLLDTSIDLKLPRFDITSNVNVKNVIKELGINKLFTDRQLSIYQGTNPIRLEELNQKLRMTVDLKGTEFGTSGSMIGIEDDQTPFHCNRPFIFLILKTTDTDIKEPIIVGHYVGQV